MPTLLILGASGQIGKEIKEQAKSLLFSLKTLQNIIIFLKIVIMNRNVITFQKPYDKLRQER